MSEKQDNLKDRLERHLSETGSISESDVANFDSSGGPSTPDSGAAMNMASEIPAVDPGQFDSTNAAAGHSTGQDHLQTEVDGMGNLGSSLLPAKAQVTITPEDKEAFVAAIISGDRMRLNFPVCGGKLSVAVRNRTLPETQALIAQLRNEMDDGTVETNLDYSVRLRAMLMAAQIEDVSGTVYPTLDTSGPLRRTQAGDDVTLPGWLPNVIHWAGLNEGMHAVLWNCVWEFESKYWAMVEDAKNQDFWLPEASTSE